MPSESFQKALDQLSTSRQKQKLPAMRNIEAGFWQILKTSLKKTKRSLTITRIESYATPGLPDVVCCAEDGSFSFMELKVIKSGKKVNLSAHQVSWHSRHSHAPTFIVVRDRSLHIRVFSPEDAVELKMVGMDQVQPLGDFPEPYDWESFWALTAPLKQV